MSSDGGSDGGASASSGAAAKPADPVADAAKLPEQVPVPATLGPSPESVTNDDGLKIAEIPQIEYIEGDKIAETPSGLLDKESIVRKASEQFGSLFDSVQDRIDGVNNAIHRAATAAHQAGEELSRNPEFAVRVDKGKTEAEQANEAVRTALLKDPIHPHEAETEFLTGWPANIYHAVGVIGTFVKETGHQYEKIERGEKAGAMLDQIEYSPASSLVDESSSLGPTQTDETAGDAINSAPLKSLLRGPSPTISVEEGDLSDIGEKDGESSPKRRDQPLG